MTIDSLETVVLTSAFIIPGFIIQGTISLFAPSPKRNEKVSFLVYLLYSVLHSAVWGWLYFFIWKLQEINMILFVATAATSSIITSFVLGVVIGLFKKFDLLRRILNKFNCNTSHMIETAWDYQFSKQKPSYVIVLLNDDTKIRGWLGVESFVSSSNEERDLFLEQYYDEDWKIIEGSNGIYIAKDQIKTINFYEGDLSDGTKK